MKAMTESDANRKVCPFARGRRPFTFADDPCEEPTMTCIGRSCMLWQEVRCNMSREQYEAIPWLDAPRPLKLSSLRAARRDAGIPSVLLVAITESELRAMMRLEIDIPGYVWPDHYGPLSLRVPCEVGRAEDYIFSLRNDALEAAFNFGEQAGTCGASR